MSVIPEVKCRRCGESFSAMRSRCPNCGTRRVTQSSRTPSPSPSTVKGTAAYERAETNTKWQMIFGLILVVTVVLAVIVMVSTSLSDSDVSHSGTTITPPVVTDYMPVIDSAPTPDPTPTPTVESIRVFFFNKELEGDFTMNGGETLDLTGQVLPLTIEGVSINWSSSDESLMVVESTDALSCKVECVAQKSGNCKLIASCLGVSKELTVYCWPAKG